MPLGGTGKPNSVVHRIFTIKHDARTVISLCERPILLLHQCGFATRACRHAASDEAQNFAIQHTIALFTFDSAQQNHPERRRAPRGGVEGYAQENAAAQNLYCLCGTFPRFT